MAEEPDAARRDEIRRVHEVMIARMQHERLIHLIVTLFIALFALLSVGFAVLTHWIFSFALSLVLLGLVSVYLVHYFRLENGVQRWYHLSDELAAAPSPPPQN
jgi:cell division protein FtsW (lipid II flippase)